VAVVQYKYTHKQYRERHKTNNTKNTKIHRTTQNIHRATQQLGRVRAVTRLCGFYPGICLTTEEKARKNLSQCENNQRDAHFFISLVTFTYIYETVHGSETVKLAVIFNFQLHQPTRCNNFSVFIYLSQPARPRRTALLSPSSDGKPEAATAIVVAPDDWHEDARNMLSCI
jgi:hypothetical protein